MLVKNASNTTFLVKSSLKCYISANDPAIVAGVRFAALAGYCLGGQSTAETKKPLHLTFSDQTY
jgi:hypothetical protein